MAVSVNGSDRKCIKKRSPNFTEKEKYTLINIVYNYKNIIENKKTDGVTSKKKEDAWVRVADDYNGSETTKRQTPQLRNLYENMKKKARKRMASELLESTKTGSSTCESQFTDMDLKMVMLLGEQLAPTLGNEFDCDGLTTTVPTSEGNDQLSTQEGYVFHVTPMQALNPESTSEHIIDVAVNHSQDISTDSCCDADPVSEVTDERGASSLLLKKTPYEKGKWKAWANHRRPKNEGKSTTKDLVAVEFAAAAEAKKNYYTHLLSMAQEKHTMEMEILKHKCRNLKDKQKP